jgi:SAM-dependent methyltransferase
MMGNKYITYLSNKTKDESFINRLKIKFRPLIFPIELLLEQIDESDTVFDIGCGSGQFSLLAVHFRKIKKVYGIEIDNELVVNANNLFEKHVKDVDYKFIQYNGNTLPDEVSLSSKIFLNDVLHHIPKEQQISFLKKIYDAMDSDAVFILKDINASSPLVYFNKLHDIIFAGEIGKELKFNSALNILKEIGFKIISTDKRNIAVYPHYTIICKK